MAACGTLYANNSVRMCYIKPDYTVGKGFVVTRATPTGKLISRNYVDGAGQDLGNPEIVDCPADMCHTNASTLTSNKTEGPHVPIYDAFGVFQFMVDTPVAAALPEPDSEPELGGLEPEME